MALFRRREVPVQIIFDQEEFQRISNLVQGLVGELDKAANRLEAAKKELIQAKKDLDASTGRLEAAKRRPASARSL